MCFRPDKCKALRRTLLHGGKGGQSNRQAKNVPAAPAEFVSGAALQAATRYGSLRGRPRMNNSMKPVCGSASRENA